MGPRLLVADCEDSFVQTLARYAREHGARTRVVRADTLQVADAVAGAPDGVILSPGPGRPEAAGDLAALIRAMPQTPILGVCLGHQALCEAYGGATGRSPEPMHGRASLVTHDGSALYAGLASPFRAARYHSLIGAPGADMRADAWSNGLVMGARHADNPHHGVQFHPESLLTEGGHRMIGNFVRMCGGPS